MEYIVTCRDMARIGFMFGIGFMFIAIFTI